MKNRYFKISVDDSRDRIIVKVHRMQGMMLAGRRVGKDGCPIKNEYVIFSPEDIKYEMIMNRHYCQLERLEN